MPFLVDSSFAIDYLNEQQYTIEVLRSPPDLVGRVVDESNPGYKIPSPVLYELYVGARRADSDSESPATVDSALSWADPVPFSRADALEASAIKDELLNEGNIINEFDILIAGIARRRDLTVLATDKDYSDVDDLSAFVIAPNQRDS
ncbi:PIN domain-containing protein [Halomarina salina]|uniref:PIN domain-containing protein n=1 Tax=Halomarina salina TaxID=1872699 RepID=A0ABD5RT60_9EURY|nr:PIN domain-containing protein [Halomarina salina]